MPTASSTNQPAQATSLRDFQTPEAIAEQFPQFPAASIRWLLRQRHLNGLAAHVRRVGKKLYIHVPGFAAWIDSRPSH